MNVLLSIKPEFAEKILSGEKTLEFRKRSFSNPDAVKRIYLYSSSPDQRIVGSFDLAGVIEGSPTELWRDYGSESGITDKARFMAYFDGAETGFALRISNVSRYPNPIDPCEWVDDFHPPVSFQYLDSKPDILGPNQPTRIASD